VDYFTSEALQLTDSVLANLTALNLTAVDLFTFSTNDTTDDTNDVSKRSTTQCKVFPSDLFWPIDLIWDIFDLLLGGALIKTTPLAAPCYKTFGGENVANAAECAYISANWYNNSFMQ
jgi:hypothetical protein